MDVEVLALANEDSLDHATVVATDGQYLAWATDQSHYVEVACLHQLTLPSLTLTHGEGHGGVKVIAVGAGTVGSSDPRHSVQSQANTPLLVVATQRSLLLWRLADQFECSNAGASTPPVVVASSLCHVTHMTICSQTNRLVVCAGEVIHVYLLQTLTHDLRLEGHRGLVLAAATCAPHQPYWLISTGEDRTFRVWDMDQAALLYESLVLTASALVSVSVDPSAFRCVLGAADGVLRFFDLESLPACRCLQVVDVAKQLSKCLASCEAHAAAVRGASGASGAAAGPRIVRSGSATAAPAPAAVSGLQSEPSTCALLCSNAVLGLAYSQLRHDRTEADTGLLGESPRLLVGCMRGLCVLDTHSYDLLQVHLCAGAGVSPSVLRSHPLTTSDKVRVCPLTDVEVPGTYAFGMDPQRRYMLACCASACGPQVAALSARPTPLPGTQEALSAQHALHFQPGLSEGAARAAHIRHSTPQRLAQAPATQPQGPGPPAAQPLQSDSHAKVLSVYLTAPLPAGSPLSVSHKGRPSSGSTSAHSGPSLSRAQSAGSASNIGPHTPGTTTPGGPARSDDGGGGGARLVKKWDRSSAGARQDAAAAKAGSSSAHTATPKLPPVPGALRRTHSTNSPGPGTPSKVKPLQDKPVVFHKQIKSSGYGFVQPQVKIGRAPPKPIKLDPRPSPVNMVAKRLLAARQYPMSSGPPVKLITSDSDGPGRPGDHSVHVGAVLGLKYSGDGSRLLTCSADKTARILRVPLDKAQSGTDLLGHNGAVTCADWSHDSTLVLTASVDRTARLWVAGCAQPALGFSGIKQSPTLQQRASGGAVGGGGGGGVAGSPAKSKTHAQPFLHEVSAARFFYLDRFVALTSGNKLHLFTYELCDGDPSDDLSRLRNNNTYHHVTSWTSTAQTLNSFAAVNTFPSPTVLLAGSNRCVEVLDCGVMQSVATLQDAHSRPVHTIVQTAGTSMFTSHPREANELFATAATDGHLKLWDLRVCRCVRTYSAHKNSQVSVGAAFSPCLRYLACGSEDQAVHVYDLRQGTLLQRLREPQGEAVTAVCYNPLTPQLAAGNLAGVVRLYAP